MKYTTSRTIPVLAPVFAGSPAPLDDWKINKFRDVRPLRGVGVYDSVAAMPVSGDSLVEQGIFDGDLLVFKFTVNAAPEKLCIWQTPHGATAKFARLNPNGTITLHNGAGWEQKWNPEDVRLVGVVLRVERDL